MNGDASPSPQKQMIVSNSAGAVVIFFLLLFVFAKWGPAVPISVLSQQKGEPFVVTGQGKTFVTPDIAKVSFGIQQSGSSLKNVQETVSQKSKSLTDSFKKLGIAEDDIRTTSYNVSPEYDYTDPSARITGFMVSITYEVTIRDFDKVNDALSQGVATGANLIGGVSFEVNDKTQKEKVQEARKEAVAEAKEKAEDLASAAGISLGRVINIIESGGEEPIRFYAADRLENMAGKGPEPATPPEIEPGQTEINIRVTLSYEVR